MTQELSRALTLLEELLSVCLLSVCCLSAVCWLSAGCLSAGCMLLTLAAESVGRVVGLLCSL